MEPQADLTDILARIDSTPMSQIQSLLPHNCTTGSHAPRCALLRQPHRWLAEDLSLLAPGGAALKTRFEGQPLPAEMAIPTSSAEIAEAVRTIAAARLGHLIKCIGICELAGMHPYSANRGVAGLMDLFNRRAREAFDVVAENSRVENAQYISRVESVVFRSEMASTILDEMSFEEVLKLRSTAWGKEGQAREEFFRRALELAAECNDTEFDSVIVNEIENYKAVFHLILQWQWQLPSWV